MKKNMIFPIAIALSLTLTACGGSAPEDQAELAETNQAWADEKYDALLENYGVKSQSELLTQNPASVQSYLVSAESPSSGTVVFTAQLTEADVDKAEVEQAAMAVLNLVGFSDETVDRVEVVTADSSVRGVANRNDSPMLNK